MTRSFVVLAVVAAASALPALAQGQAQLQQPAGVQPAASRAAVHAASAPQLAAAAKAGEVRLDGRLDEAAWAQAQPAGRLIQRDPNENQAPSERTEVRVLVGDGALWIGARMYDREPARIVRRLGRRDERPASDRLTIRLDARHDHLTAFLFDIFPAGNKGDAAVGSDEFEDYSWDPVWDVATAIDGEGWTAEARIPLSQLRFDPRSDTWGIQLVRFIQRRQEEDVLAYIPKTESGGVNRYGHLTGMRGIPAPRRMEVIPYTSATARFEDVDAADPFRSGQEVRGSVGADLRLGITSDLNLDATINPDFGQVELDPAVVNLTAFETSFDEKRPFFVESADLFRFGLVRTFNNYGTPTTFFSRRIGRRPQVNATGDADFAEAPEQTTILAAAKLTGKLRGGWSVALLDAVTPEETGRYALGAAPVRESAVEPLSNYFAGRVRRELNQGNTAVGALVTTVHRTLEDAALADTLRGSAYLAGLDFNHSWGERNWTLDGFVAGTVLRGTASAIGLAQRSSARYYQRPDAEALEYDPARTSLGGYASQLALTKQGGGHWGGNLALSAKSPGYETNDLGFTQTVGRMGVATDIHYYQPTPGLFRTWTIGFLTGNEWNYDGDNTSRYVGTILNSQWRNFWSVNANYFHDLPSYDDQLTRGGPIARRPYRSNLNFDMSSDSRGFMTVGVDGNVNWNGAGGWGTTVGVNVAVQPAPTVRVSFEPSFSRFHNVSQFVRGVTDADAAATFGRRAVFATLDQRELALDTRLDWTFTPTLSLQLYVQPLISTGAYGDIKEFARPGTFDFDVYGRDRGTIAFDRAANSYTVDPDGDGPAAEFTVDNPDFNFRSLLGNLVFRWEYRPGSTLFLVWQQTRSGEEPFGDFRLGRDFGAIFDQPARNVLAVKMSYWLGL